jgi:hypothetical protein
LNEVRYSRCGTGFEQRTLLDYNDSVKTSDGPGMGVGGAERSRRGPQGGAMTKALRISILFCTLAFMAGGRLPGQATSARIYGSVQNEKGEFLAGVEVTAINVASNAETKTRTSGDKGTFNFLGVAPGSYQVSFDVKGYYSYVAAGIQLSAGQSTTLRITMKRPPWVDGAAPGEEPKAESPADVGPFKAWQVEFSAGAFDKQPNELNNFVYSDLRVCRDLPIEYYRQYRNNGLSISSYFGRPTGELLPIAGLQPLTVRLRFSLNRLFSLAAGIAWSSRQPASAFAYAFDFYNSKPESNHLPPGHFSVISEFPDYHLGVKALFPHVGAQVVLDKNRRFQLAGFAHAGWMFAKCSFSSSKIVHDGLLGQVITQELAMEGRGSGPALEAGIKLELDVWRGLGAFIEGGYLLSWVTRVTGKSAGSKTVRDQKTLATLSSATETREGRWWIGDDFSSRPAVWPGGGPATGSPFTLDLGGLGIRAGLFFRF